MGVLLLLSFKSYFNVTDINECTSPTICGAPGSAVCTNTEASYTCSCNNGYFGGGNATRCHNSKFEYFLYTWFITERKLFLAYLWAIAVVHDLAKRKLKAELHAIVNLQCAIFLVRVR